MRTVFVIVLSVLAVLAAPATAEVKMPALFGDNMVLQRDMKVPVWGLAGAGEKVTVTFAGQSVSTVAGKDGKWSVKLAPLKASAESRELVIKASNTVAIKNVLVGDVWICSGQSNMRRRVRQVANPKAEVADASDFPNIRLNELAAITALSPQDDNPGSWHVNSSARAREFSAVGYFFGRDLHKHLKVPIGLINTSWGGTRAESWISRAKMEKYPYLAENIKRWDRRVKEFDPKADQQQYDKKLEIWRAKVKQAEAEGKKPPRKPYRQRPLGKHPGHPASLYNGMVHPLIPFGIRGVIWYQGESNRAVAAQYNQTLTALIEDWRARWGQGDFPFLFVQLPNFGKLQSEPKARDVSLAMLREGQLKTLALANTAMAITIDIGEADDIHPKNKQDVGKRLALAARAVVYGEKIVHSGPVYKSMSVNGDKITLKFNHVGGGLVARGDELKGFAITAGDGKWFWAKAKIVGETIVISSDKVTSPKYVRYAWAGNPICNLYNKQGLPASPFRTDEDSSK